MTSIMSYDSQLFYENKILHANEVLQRPILIPGLKPVTIVHYSGLQVHACLF